MELERHDLRFLFEVEHEAVDDGVLGCLELYVGHRVGLEVPDDALDEPEGLDELGRLQLGAEDEWSAFASMISWSAPSYRLGTATTSPTKGRRSQTW